MTGRVTFDFSGQTIIVTGAGSGIGAATAALLHDSGAQVIAADLAFTDKNSPLCQQSYDAADPDAATKLVAYVNSQYGEIDHLVICAGIYQSLAAPLITDQDWQRMLAVNLGGPFLLIRASVPVMREGGSIVALSSIAAHQGGSLNHSHYGAAKGGLLALVRGLARDLAPRVRVNAVSPGTIDTPMVRQRVAAGGQTLLETIPLGRLGQPAEMARICAFLCSDGASYVTGETIIASGGLYMG